jgi:acetyl esterase
MPLDKQAEALIKQLEALDAPPLNSLSPVEARLAAAGFAEMAGSPEPVSSVVNTTVLGPLGEIPVRIYTPEGTAPLPIVVYFHGGGWVLGTLDTVDVLCSILANRAGAIVVSVDYRLAPEHKFPAAVIDCFAATKWAAANAAELGGDAQRVAVAGDSAGGNLAAVVAALARDEGGPNLAYQALLFPVTNRDFATQSYRDNGEGYFLTTDMMKWFWDHYLNTEEEHRDWRASPMALQNVDGLPAAFVATAEFDPLRDEGEAYAELLRSAGISVTTKRYDGQIHDFITMAVMDEARPAAEHAASLLRDAFEAQVAV